MRTNLPAPLSEEPYASFIVKKTKAGSKPLAGLRIGVVREYMVKLSLRRAPLSDKLNMRRILGEFDNTNRDATKHSVPPPAFGPLKP